MTAKKRSLEDIKKHHAQYSLRKTTTLDDQPKIEGYDFSKPFDFQQFLDSYATTGFQATNLSQAIEITKAMQREKATIFLGFTSNMVSSGNRDIIRYLVQHKKVHVLVTSAGGIEEDIIKCLKPFVLGNFESSGKMLHEHGVNRTGNIFVPNDRFAYFDQWMQPFLKKMLEQQKKSGDVLCPKDFNRELGIAINNPSSILYWAAKHNIPVFCPGIIDGSLGDMLYFFKQSHPEFLLDVTKEIKDIVDIALNADKAGAILLGGGISKHFVLNANIFREGLDYAVYINTAQEFDGSDSGARTDEAVTWGKIKAKALQVKVHCDATIAFPLLVAGAMIDHDEGVNRK
ncbi:deoxyhypusine synthase [Candidatus Woesearchaeota archaeon]|nr:deoxyhypusine synthase [Candidatus Woesearchaeota archaeon]